MVKHSIKQLELWCHSQGLTFEEDGYYFEVDNGMKGNIKSNQNQKWVYITVYLNAVQALSDIASLQKALSFNLYQEETQGGTIAYDPILNDLTLCYMLDAKEVNDNTLSHTVANLISCGMALSEKLRMENSVSVTSFNTQASLENINHKMLKV